MEKQKPQFCHVVTPLTSPGSVSSEGLATCRGASHPQVCLGFTDMSRPQST